MRFFIDFEDDFYLDDGNRVVYLGPDGELHATAFGSSKEIYSAPTQQHDNNDYKFREIKL